MHVTGGNNLYEPPGLTKREADQQQPPGIGLPERMIARLHAAMSLIGQSQQWSIEEDLLRLALAHSVLVSALAVVARVPLEALRSNEINHWMYMAEIYKYRKPGASAHLRFAPAAPPRILAA
jgi:hypothetical protein